MSTRERFAEVVRAEPVDLGLACLLVGGEVDPGLDPEQGLAALDALAARAAPYVAPGCSPAEAAAGLRVALGAYGGSAADYEDVRSSLLHEVLRRRRGLPLTLAVVWVEVARRLGVPAAPVALPGHVVVAVGDEDPVHLDAFAGGRLLDVPALSAQVRAAAGRPLVPQDLVPAAPVELLLRLLTNVRALGARSPRLLEGARTRLWATELSLLLPRHPAALRRERGELLVRLGEHARGAAELEAYADAVAGADPDAEQRARRESRLARARLN